VGFGHIHHAEVRFFLVLLEPTVERGHIGPKWRSRATAKDQNSQLLSSI
jgi:hypothetical protein